MQSWGQFERTLIDLWFTWGLLGLNLGDFRPNVSHIGVNLGVLVAVLAPTWAVLRPSRCELGLCWSQLGPTWSNLDQLRVNLEPT